ncbi:MAG: hypothetical protein M1824_004028 [Vezdaea acicularis]|nr:MAG: hypothetical protein M1824_004028 [Vezdaea acicularis]
MAPATVESASPIGIANLPNQRHKIVAKRGAAFTIMVAGESGLGKTTFINTLFSTTIKNYADHKRRHAKQVDKTVEIEITKAELEEKFFKVRLTVIDTPGFGDYVNNRDSWMPIIEFLDDQHESYMLQEQQPKRVDKIDLRVHACLYFIRPTGHTLKPLDIEVMKRLSSRVNLIPVVAKADTLSPIDLAKFKQRIRAVVEAQGIKIYQPPLEEDDEAAAQHARSLMAAMPFAVIGSEKDVKTSDGRIVKGRQYSWGVAEVENEDHCDFKKLRSILIRTHMLDLIHTTEEMHYEAYRAQQMETRKFGEARPRKLDNPKFKEEEESLRKRFTEQVKIEEHRFRQWEQKLISERDRLNKDLESTHAAIKQLEDAPLFAELRSSLPALFESTGSFENSPKHHSKLNTVLDLWLKNSFFTPVFIAELRERSRASRVSKQSLSTKDEGASSRNLEGPKLGQDAPFLVPTYHGEFSTPWYDLPAATLMPHIIPDPSAPINTRELKPLKLLAGPADATLITAVKCLLKDVNDIYQPYLHEDEGIMIDIDPMGQPAVRDKSTGELKKLEAYYGWSKDFCERTKNRRRRLGNLSDDGRERHLHIEREVQDTSRLETEVQGFKD